MGEVSQHSEYFAFGETFVEEHKNSHNSPYKFNGKELDEESGLYYYGARYYDPRISIWASVDPLAEKTMSPYGYCYNNPVNMVDPDGRYAVSVHYRITVNAMIKMGYSKEVARRIAHGASMYADHPDKKALFLNNLGKSGSLHYRDDMDYSKTAGSQDEKNSRWHSMMSNEEKKNGMTHYEAMQRGLQFGWSNIFAQEEGLDESKIYQGLHALQDAYAHNGASTDEHLKLPTISAIEMLRNDMYGDTSKAELITETAAVVLSLFNKKNNAANLKNGMKLDFNGMSNKQLEKVTNLLYENGFVLEKTKKLDNTYVLKQNF
ncbi:RHS repeat-associated core domain-containing protein [Flavobacterium branchiophilum]|uniref:RHS repeat domain-containing protein n=1 Tax=Flavobacterium branchiophilum TaxID=55197 RepID=UPI00030C55BA|nr:RHS repeat-associated core domain-containing protein [Flavobacterium branchiophilum]